MSRMCIDLDLFMEDIKEFQTKERIKSTTEAVCRLVNAGIKTWKEQEEIIN
jgi:hypothetical protein